MLMRVVMALVVLGGAGELFAQPVPAPPGLNVSALPKAAVLDQRGVETRGRLFNIDQESVVLIVDGAQRRFPLSEVNRVTRSGDSLKNGAIIGAVVGAVMGALTSGLAECKRDGHWTSCGAGHRAGIAVVGAGVYAAMGAGIDGAVSGRTVLYQAPTSGSTGVRSQGASIAWRVSW